MPRRLALVVIFCCPALTHASDYASDNVQMDVIADGATNLILTISASPDGGHVTIPLGAVFTAGGNRFQDVVVGQAVDLELEPHQRVEMVVVAYCMNRDRSSAPVATTMNYHHMAPPEVMRALQSTKAPDEFPNARDPFQPSAATQHAIWNALGQRPSDH